MNAPEIKKWIHRLQASGFVLHLRVDEKSQVELLRLFDLLDEIEPMGGDNRVELWLPASRGSYEEYAMLSDEEPSLAAFLEEYPDETCWFPLVTVHHTVGGRYAEKPHEYYGLFLDHEYILHIHDVNAENARGVDARELLAWLVASVTDTIKMIQAGTYNDYVNQHLPMEQRYGRILRKDYWDIYPENRQSYRNCFEPGQIEQFLQCAAEFDEDRDFTADHVLQKMTARQFYEACAVCYRADPVAMMRLERRRARYRFVDEEAEIARYGNVTPKEMYYMLADCRDDGLQKVPLDDPEEFMLWYQNKGCYEFNGSHPWEILMSASIRESIHLYTVHEGNGWHFTLSGRAFSRSTETIRMYMAMRQAGLPVALSHGRELAGRLSETDWIGIEPVSVYTGGSEALFGAKVVDIVDLERGDKPEQVAQKAVWMDLPIAKMKEVIK